MTDNEVPDAPFIDKPKRNPAKWKGKGKGDPFANKAKKNRKHREQEMHEDDLDDEIRDYK
jgi:hypothetical protein